MSRLKESEGLLLSRFGGKAVAFSLDAKEPHAVLLANKDYGL